MLSSSTYALFRIAGWTYLPDLITQTLLRILHSQHPLSPIPRLFSSSPFTPPPRPHTPRYAKHYRLTFSSVVLLFLLYNLIEAARYMPPNFYEILGVDPSVDEGGLKVAFRAFARKHHPDRPSVGREGEALFIEVRDAFEALKDPVVRFAYDRFGADVLTWMQCTTTREYLRRGLMQSSGYHIVTGAGLLFFSAVGKPSAVAFWRYLLFAAVFASELGLLLSPSPSPSSLYVDSSLGTSIHSPPHHNALLTILFPRRVAYQHILLLHQLFMFMSIAISRVAPVLIPVMRESLGLAVQTECGVMDGSLIERFGALVRAADRELYLMLHTELHSVEPPHKFEGSRTGIHSQRTSPLKPIAEASEEIMDTLTQEMQNMIIENKLRKEAPLRSIWEAAVTRGPIKERERAVSMFGNSGNGLLSPVSQAGELSSWVEVGDGGLQVGSTGRLPSPRPSPPPPLHGVIVRRGSNFVRARSISC